MFFFSSCFCLYFHRASTLSNAVSSLANTGISFTKVDEREKQAALEEEHACLKTLKVCYDTPNSTRQIRYTDKEVMQVHSYTYW